MKGKTKQAKGITLIALIITIVVLLILAVVAINSIQNDGILGHAQNAAGTYNQAVKNEQGMLKEYEDYLTGINGGFEAYTVGQEITIGGETFYVIKDSAKTESKVLLLAKLNIDTTTLKQGDLDGDPTIDSNKIAFSSTRYWAEDENNYVVAGMANVLPKYKAIEDTEGNIVGFNLTEEGEPDESHYAAYAAYQYGVKLGGTGRLMTYPEANALRNNSTFSSKLNEVEFWLGTGAHDCRCVCSSLG